MTDDEMKDEYDFSKGERGKFYKPNARFHVPVYLDDTVMGRFPRLRNARVGEWMIC